MKIAGWAGVILFFVTCAANAQRADCPMRDAPIPMTPPGKPPDFIPKITIPKSFEEEVKVEKPKILPASGKLTEAEEGHLTGVLLKAEVARLVPPADDVLRGLVDPRKTILSSWRFEGYLPDMPRHKVPRVFTRDGSVLIFEQWNMKADGASIAAIPQPSLKVGRWPGNHSALRTPSGCVSASLGWFGNGVSYSLKVVGPLSLKEQQALLLKVARSIDLATPSLARY